MNSYLNTASNRFLEVAGWICRSGCLYGYHRTPRVTRGHWRFHESLIFCLPVSDAQLILKPTAMTYNRPKEDQASNPDAFELILLLSTKVPTAAKARKHSDTSPLH